MACLDVDAVEARLGGEPSGVDVGVLESVQVVVGNDGVVVRKAVRGVEDAATLSDDGLRYALGLAVPPRVRELHDHDRLVAGGINPSPLRLADDAFKCLHVALVAKASGVRARRTAAA